MYVILNAIQKFIYIDFSNDSIDKIVSYLSMYNKSELNEQLNKRIIEPTINNKEFNTIYSELAIVNYGDILGIIDKVDVTIIDKTIIRILLKYQELYEYNDIKHIELLIQKLNILLNRNVVENYISHRTNGWICLCGVKNVRVVNNCTVCGKGRNGLSSEQFIQINKVIEHLNNINAILASNYGTTE